MGKDIPAKAAIQNRTGTYLGKRYGRLKPDLFLASPLLCTTGGARKCTPISRVVRIRSTSTGMGKIIQVMNWMLGTYYFVAIVVFDVVDPKNKPGLIKRMGATVPIERIILFDGVCNFVQRFGSVCYPAGQEKKIPVCLPANLNSQKEKLHGMVGDAINTIVLLKNDKTYFRSDAALEISRELNGLWPALYVLKIIPRFIRNFIYDLISRNRYRWFGKREACWIPSSEWSARFVD